MIEIENRGEVCLLRMQHGKVNSMDLEFCQGLTSAFKDIAANKSRAVVLTGQGSAFSAGVDLLRLLKEDIDYTRQFLQALSDLFETVFSIAKPVVAAINGHAIAGGCILACTADYRILAKGSARMGVPELRVGVPFPPMALEIMRFAVADRHFQSLTLGGETCSVDRALETGLVDLLEEPDSLLDKAMAFAADYASLNSSAFGLSKQLIRDPVLQRVARMNKEFESEIDEIWCSQQTRTYIRNFVEKTFGSGKKG